MGFYVAIKLPFAVLLTLVVNGVLNGMLGLALGSGIGFRQSWQFLLVGFAIMSVILGGTFAKFTTNVLYTAEDVVSASEMVNASGVDYQPPSA